MSDTYQQLRDRADDIRTHKRRGKRFLRVPVDPDLDPNAARLAAYSSVGICAASGERAPRSAVTNNEWARRT